MAKHDTEKKHSPEHAVTPVAEKKHRLSALKANAKFWMYATGAVALVLVIVLASGFTAKAADSSQFKSAAECSSEAIAFLNNNLVQPGTTATLKDVSESGGVYIITTNYQNSSIPVYMTKNCEMLFVSAINTSQEITTSTVETKAPEKTAKPSVEVFVMAFCPYGVQAENAIKPVVDLLGNKADIQIHFIAGVNGNNVSDVDSLHGLQEAKEDLRQVCVMKYYPTKYWSYLMGINDKCYSIYRDAAAMDSCWKNVSANLSIDATKIETCAYGSEGITLLKADEALSTERQASGSPTIIINGAQYSGARTAEGFKTAICSAFITAPAECATALSESGQAASGNC